MSLGRRQHFLIVLILGVLSTVTPLAIDLYLPAFPRIAGDLGGTPADVSLSVSSYFVGFALGQIFYGPLLDRYGRRVPLYAGMVLFALASLGCAVAQSVDQLVIFRFLQALGGCSAQVASLAMVRDFFPVDESAKILSLLLLVISVSPLAAPTLGSFIAVTFGWQWIFISLAVIALLAIITSRLFLPPARPPDPEVSLEIRQIVFNFVTIFREPQFNAYTLSGSFSFAGLLVYVTGSPILFMSGFHVSPAIYGAIFALLSIGFIGSSQINILLLRRFKSGPLFRVALNAQVVVSAAFLLTAIAGAANLVVTVAFLAAFLSCLGLSYPNAAAMALAPFENNAGSASALLGFMQIGIAASASSCVGLMHAQDGLPTIIILFATSVVGLGIFTAGNRKPATETVAS